MPSHFCITLQATSAPASLISLLRRHTGISIADVRQAISKRKPILDEMPHHNQYSAFITRVTELLDALDAQNIAYRVTVDGATESRDYLRNAFQSWHDIRVESRRLGDLESGEPCIETLEWLKRHPAADVFRQTIRQIIDGDGYRCDEQTVAWARAEWEATKRDDAADRPNA